MMNCVVTVFIDDIRIATTIKNENGEYLVGTKLNNDIIHDTVYKERVIYEGNNVINGLPYKTINEVVNNTLESVEGFKRITAKTGSTKILVTQLENAMSEQQASSKQVLDALNDITNSSNEVQNTSKEISAGMSNVSAAAENLTQISETVAGSMDEMTHGVQEINSSAQNGSEMASKTKENIGVVKSNIDKFIL